jgi:hypothetical protein
MHFSEKLIINIALAALFFKLLLSPWSTGDFESPVFITLNYLCDGVILASIICYIPFTDQKLSFIYITAIVLALSFVLSTVLLTDNTIFKGVSVHLRVYLPLLFLTMLASFFSRNPIYAINIAKKQAIYAALLLFLGLIFLPVSHNRTEVWWPSYFGGLHTTAYVAMSVFFTSFALYLTQQIKGRSVVVIGVVVFCCVFFGWGVRTITGAFLIAAGLYLVDKFRVDGLKIMQLVMLVFVPLGFFLLILTTDIDNFDHFTSGRLSMYSEKIDQLSRNTLFAWFFGNGAGSDLITTDIWWWAAKGAHSDLITMLVEGGVIYLGGTLFIFYKLYNMFSTSPARFLILAFLFTSAFSNGYLVRPLPCYLFYFSLALLYSQLGRKNVEK